jgi:Uma2 family endonuclease
MKAGVSEYWLVNPMDRLVEIFSQQDGVYVPYGRFEREAVVQSNCLPDLCLPLAEVWE